MNGFLVIFGDSIKAYWEQMREEDKQSLFDNILVYANSNPETFKKEIEEIRFNHGLQPLPIVLEALSKDTDNWGHYYVDLMDVIFKKAKLSHRPQDVVDHLIEFAVIEKQEKQFVGQIANRLYKEIHSDNIVTKCAAISMLTHYVANPVVKDKRTMIRELQNKLVNPKWVVRYVAYISLRPHGLLPKGYKLSFTDAVTRLIKGRPLTF